MVVTCSDRIVLVRVSSGRLTKDSMQILLDLIGLIISLRDLLYHGVYDKLIIFIRYKEAVDTFSLLQMLSYFPGLFPQLYFNVLKNSIRSTHVIACMRRLNDE